MTASMRRPIGAALAGALSAVLFVMLLLLARATPSVGVLYVAMAMVALGTPVAIVLGWRFGPRLAESDAVGLIAWMGTSAMLLGLLEVLVILVASAASAGAVVVLLVFFAAAFGLLIGLVVTPFTIACAAVWVVAFMLIEQLTAVGTNEAPAGPGPQARL